MTLIARRTLMAGAFAAPALASAQSAYPNRTIRVINAYSPGGTADVLSRILYTKLSDLKVSMQAEAAKDARQRAQSIAEAAGAGLGEVRWARMTAPSITPQYSNSDDDGGTDDTSSLEKKITAIVTVGYGVK